MRNVKTFILMPFLLAGCTVGPDYAGPPPLGHSAPPPSFVRQPGSVASAAPALADWWTAFNDPVLNDLEKRALAANPSIEAAQARISQARASVRQERANLFPTAGAQATAIFADLPGLAYARVDLLPTDSGPVVLELELTEPSLFLALHPDAPARAATAFRALLN